MARMASTKAIDYESIIVSRPFRFLVGAEKLEFMLHSEVVSRLSKSLNALVNGQMKEAREDCATWEDVDVNTFIRFSKFAYTGDYDAAQPCSFVSASDDEGMGAELPFSNVSIPAADWKDRWGGGWGEGPASPAETETVGWRALGLPSPCPTSRNSGLLSLWHTFANRYELNIGCWGESGLTPIRNREDDDYTSVFLSHARMAVFADYHGVSTLETLALGKLTSLLVGFGLWEARAGDIAHLISYVYDSTAQHDDSACGLRELVCQYSACKMEVLWKSAHFREIFRTSVEFSEDLMGQLLRRLG